MPSHLTRRHALGALATSICLPSIAMSLPSNQPPEVASALNKAQLLGQASLRFFGLLVYDARLWTRADFDAERYDSQAFGLELEYARKLEGMAIAERSIAEMKRIGDFSDAQSKAWLSAMLQAFPDVGAKDRLVGLHDGRGGVRFYFNGKPTATLADKDFARLFFGIWLSPRTSSPALRASLIGQG